MSKKVKAKKIDYEEARRNLETALEFFEIPAEKIQEYLESLDELYAEVHK